jgi:1-acyl-sn-glycerol-3-phosphate acyltransferase
LFVYNLWYWPYLLVSCALLFMPALGIWAVTAPFDSKRRLLAKYTGMWGAHYLASMPYASVTIRNRERGADIGPCVYVSNHQSLCDVLALFKLGYPFLWVSKVENFFAPFLGWNMWLNNYVPLKRGYLPSIMRMYRTCIRRLQEGHSLFVFPEGTRTPDGKLKSFYPGAFRIAIPTTCRSCRSCLRAPGACFQNLRASYARCRFGCRCLSRSLPRTPTATGAHSTT